MHIYPSPILSVIFRKKCAWIIRIALKQDLLKQFTEFVFLRKHN